MLMWCLNKTIGISVLIRSLQIQITSPTKINHVTHIKTHTESHSISHTNTRTHSHIHTHTHTHSHSKFRCNSLDRPSWNGSLLGPFFFEQTVNGGALSKNDRWSGCPGLWIRWHDLGVRETVLSGTFGGRKMVPLLTGQGLWWPGWRGTLREQDHRSERTCGVATSIPGPNTAWFFRLGLPQVSGVPEPHLRTSTTYERGSGLRAKHLGETGACFVECFRRCSIALESASKRDGGHVEE